MATVQTFRHGSIEKPMPMRGRVNPPEWLLVTSVLKSLFKVISQ